MYICQCVTCFLSQHSRSGRYIKTPYPYPSHPSHHRSPSASYFTSRDRLSQTAGSSSSSFGSASFGSLDGSSSSLRAGQRVPLHEAHLSLTSSFFRSQQNTAEKGPSSLSNGARDSLDDSGADVWVNPNNSAGARKVNNQRHFVVTCLHMRTLLVSSPLYPFFIRVLFILCRRYYVHLQQHKFQRSIFTSHQC